jgi:hypothetical protein
VLGRRKRNGTGTAILAQYAEAARLFLTRHKGITIPLLGNVSAVMHSSQAFPRLYGPCFVYFLLIDGLSQETKTAQSNPTELQSSWDTLAFNTDLTAGTCHSSDS